jgi:hypothetical protein
LKQVRWLRRVLGVVVVGLTVLLAFIGLEVVIAWHCDLQSQISPPAPQPEDRKEATASITNYLRPEDDTYLSYPEWYIVWSYQEKADFQEKHLPSGFPYLAAVRQYWTSYCCISRLTRGRYAFNGGEQVMLVIIGTSFSVEYIIKSGYEKSIGKLSEWSSGGQQVSEDDYAYKVAREYADFVQVRPFYEFQFARHIGGLWHGTPLWGEHELRKLERKVFLSFDYLAEAFYCWLIEKATHLTYGHEPDKTYAWIDNTGQSSLANISRVRVVKQAGPRAFIVELPRYQEFSTVAEIFAQQEIYFLEIAGNAHIIVSVLAPQSWNYEATEGGQLFSSTVLTHPEIKRVIIRADVPSLHALLNDLRANQVNLEHVYDY